MTRLPAKCSPGSVARAKGEGASPLWETRSGGPPLWLGPAGRRGSSVEFASDNVDRPECGDGVGDHVAGQKLRQGRHDGKAWGANTHAIRVAGSIADHVKAELSIGPFNREIDFTLGGAHSMPVHDQLELLHQSFDVAVCVLFRREEDALFAGGD